MSILGQSAARIHFPKYYFFLEGMQPSSFILPPPSRSHRRPMSNNKSKEITKRHRFYNISLFSCSCSLSTLCPILTSPDRVLHNDDEARKADILRLPFCVTLAFSLHPYHTIKMMTMIFIEERISVSKA